MKEVLKKASIIFFALVILSGINSIAFPVLSTPVQTKQGCQTESTDYLVDIIWTEFGPWIYTLTEAELWQMTDAMGFNNAAKEAFIPLILADGTLVAYFGPCCFKGGPQTYVDPRNNRFPNGCCKSPDFSTFPVNYLGDGNGNPCLCQSGLHPTPEGRTYGGTVNDFVILNGTPYLIIAQVNGEEWLAIPLPP